MTSPKSSSSDNPRISIIFPLVDDRGAGIESFEGWITQQAPASHYEIVVVDGGGNRRLAEAVRARLRPNDRLVTIESANEACLYNAGAKAAAAELLFFTESHVLPQNDVVTQVVRHFESTADVAAAVASTHSSRNRLARVDECLFESELPGVRKAEPWRWVSLRGFAVRAKTFQLLGPFDEDCRRFAETIFGLRIHESGRKIGWIDSTRLAHVNIQTLANMAEDLRNCAMGQAAFRQRGPASQIAKLGDFAHHAARPLGIPRIAGSVALASWTTLWRDGWRRGCSRRNRSLLSSLPLLIATWCVGAKARWLWARMAAHFWGFLFLARLFFFAGRKSSDMTPLLPAFFRIRLAWNSVGQWEHAMGAEEALLRQPWGRRKSLAVEQFPAASFVGFGTLETWQGAPCRWASPFASLRIEHPPFDGFVMLKVDLILPCDQRGLRVFWNGNPVAPADLDVTEQQIQIRVSSRACHADEQLVTFASTPLRRQTGIEATLVRRGFAFFGARLEPAASTAPQAAQRRGLFLGKSRRTRAFPGRHSRSRPPTARS